MNQSYLQKPIEPNDLHRVLVNVANSDWAVHFIAPDGKTRIGPWLCMTATKRC